MISRLILRAVGRVATCLSFALTPLAAQTAGPANFEVSQTRPLGLSPDGSRLFVLNTPLGRLSVFDVSDAQAAVPTLLREIAVGLDPVSLQARTNDEVWVVNAASGSVSVVAVGRGAILDTLACPSDPGDVAFAGGKAFVSCAGGNTVRVFDATTRAPLGVIPIQGLAPRALAVNADGTKVYAAMFLSGNRTTLLPPNLAPGQPNPTNPALPAPPQVGLIVPADDARLQPRLNQPDNDVAEIDPGTATVTRYFPRLGTIHFALAVRPGSAEVWTAHTEARNLVRFEPTLRGHAVDHRLARVDLASGAAGFIDLNPGLDYSLLPNPAARATALAQPTALAFEPDGAHVWVASFGTDRVARVRAADGAIVQRIETGPTSGGVARPAEKRGPRGLVYHAANGRLYVANRLSNTLTVVAPAGGAVLGERAIGTADPTPAAVRAGRGFLYDALLSGNGTQSCAVCHIDGHRDDLAWDLGDPGGEMQQVSSQPVGSPFPLSMDMHPMKGPMTTQTLRGLAGLDPLHWRGDRAGFEQFNGAFASLLGGSTLSAAEMTAFRDFIRTVRMPANPNQNLDRIAPRFFPPGAPDAGDTVAGQNTYVNEVYNAGLTCATCHTLPTGTNGTLIPAFALQESQSFKVPQLRDAFQKVYFRRSATAVSLSGYGFTHDGVDPDLFTFLSRPVFNRFANDTTRKRNLTAFVQCFDTGTAPAVGYARTLTAASRSAGEADWTTLEAQARAGNIDLVARGQFGGETRGFVYRVAANDYASDRAGLGPFSRAQLRRSVDAGSLTLTLLGTAPGDGETLARQYLLPALTFAQWQALHFTPAELANPAISGAGADADGDGEDNQSEFASLSDPRVAASVAPLGRAINLSTRLRAQTGDAVAIGGFVIGGALPKRVLVRALGPSLAAAGVSGVLPDPSLELFNAAGVSLARNDGWRATQQAEIQASGFAPGSELEAALLVELAPGAYTAVVRGAGASTGVAIVEVYDLAPTADAQLINLSTRGRVETGDSVMIGGFVVGAGLGADASGSARVLVRAIGPSLAAAGLSGVLADPTLELRDAAGNLVASNDDWASSQAADIQATGLAPTSAAECAVLATLPRGAYTAVVRGKGGSSGIALVEVYKLP
ncbi:MAG: beta-propeller fold lactonase family protein [Verrucomicrobia bacterium]|nr:beta-propeller fold lactonase family protein [Verrucomicrobiota bacterium]